MNKNKNIMWLCTIIILISAISITNTTIKLCLIIPSIIIALFIFYKNAPEMVNLSSENVKIKLVKRLTVITVLFVILVICISVFAQNLPENLVKNILLILFTLYFIYFGNECPKIPCNRYLGLRLPWTIGDEQTWRYAHKIVGYLSFPGAIIMLLIGIFYSFEIGIILGISIFAIIPSIMSYKFYKKSYNK